MNETGPPQIPSSCLHAVSVLPRPVYTGSEFGTNNHKIIDKSSPELHGTHASTIGHMLQIQLLILLTLGMEVDSTDAAIALVEADVIEALEARTRNRLDAVVGY
jgi:hypothetical protein